MRILFLIIGSLAIGMLAIFLFILLQVWAIGGGGEGMSETTEFIIGLITIAIPIILLYRLIKWFRHTPKHEQPSTAKAISKTLVVVFAILIPSILFINYFKIYKLIFEPEFKTIGLPVIGIAAVLVYVAVKYIRSRNLKS